MIKLKKDNSNNSKSSSLIAKTLIIKGNIAVGTGSVEIDGVVEGDIKGNAIIIHKNGHVSGNIVASETAIIEGKFNGSIKAKKVNILNGAIISADIEYCSISVEKGSSISGQLKQN